MTDVQKKNDNIKFHLFSATGNQSKADLKCHNKNLGKLSRELIKLAKLSWYKQSMDMAVWKQRKTLNLSITVLSFFRAQTAYSSHKSNLHIF